MDRDSQHKQLSHAVRKARDRYLKISNEYDGFLQQAHESAHPSLALIDALSKANALGPELTIALNEYRDAVERLAVFLSNHD